MRVRVQPSVGIARRSLPTAARAPRIAAGLIKAILNPAGRIAACCRHRDFGVADRDRLAGESSRIRSRRIEIQRSRRPQCCHGRLQIIDREQRHVAGDRPDRLMPRIQLIRLCLTATGNLQHAVISNVDGEPATCRKIKTTNITRRKGAAIHVQHSGPTGSRRETPDAHRSAVKHGGDSIRKRQLAGQGDDPSEMIGKGGWPPSICGIGAHGHMRRREASP